MVRAVQRAIANDERIPRKLPNKATEESEPEEEPDETAPASTVDTVSLNSTVSFGANETGQRKKPLIVLWNFSNWLAWAGNETEFYHPWSKVESGRGGRETNRDKERQTETGRDTDTDTEERTDRISLQILIQKNLTRCEWSFDRKRARDADLVLFSSVPYQEKVPEREGKEKRRSREREEKKRRERSL